MDSNSLFLTVLFRFFPVKFYLFAMEGIWIYGMCCIIASVIYIFLEYCRLLFFIEIIFSNDEVCNISCMITLYNFG